MNQSYPYIRTTSTPKTFLSNLDNHPQMGHNGISYSFQMKSIQLAPRLRYLQMNDDAGDFGILIVHDGSHVNYTIQVESHDELRAAIESFIENPIGTLA